MRRIDIVKENNVLKIAQLQDLDRPVLLFMGEEILDIVKLNNVDHFYFVHIPSITILKEIISIWHQLKLNFPAKALFVYDKFAAQLISENINVLKLKSSFENIPLIVFSKAKDEKIKSISFSIKADDYIHREINFPELISKVSFAKKLKRFGVTKQDALIELDDGFKMYFLKRVFDILVSGSILLFTLPIFIIVALIIRFESKGPIFYISKRAGNYYSVFNFYKFRSMQPDADKLLAKLKESSNQYKDGNQFVKIKDDPRVTRFGHFIRNTSIDELPQLLNVLKGDMSIVGNRPLPLYEAELLVSDDHAERFLAPAGITGLWQTLKRGKSDMSSEERITLDRIYVRKNSLWFDMKLILMTFPALLQSEKV
ncbi:MAG: sugar transferase [Reichenbachiella sp.]